MVRRHQEHPPTFDRDSLRILAPATPAGTLSVNLERRGREIKELPEQSRALTCYNVDIRNIFRTQVNCLGVGFKGFSQHFFLGFTAAESVESNDIQASLLYLGGAPLHQERHQEAAVLLLHHGLQADAEELAGVGGVGGPVVGLQQGGEPHGEVDHAGWVKSESYLVISLGDSEQVAKS